MSSIAINSNFERDQYTAVAGQTQFTYSFPIFSEDFITVYKRPGTSPPDDNIDILNLGTDYSVSGVGAAEGGFITLVVPAAAGDIVTVVGTEPIERESVFQDLNPFTVALNQQLNEETVMIQQSYTYWNHCTPRYNFSELVSDEVRPQKRILPMLPNGHVWIGRGTIGNVPDDIVTAFFGSAGTGNVTASGPGMRPSIAVWTGTDFILTDSNITIIGDMIAPSVGAGEVGGFTNTWDAFHWPAHNTANRPGTANNGDVYYDTDFMQFFGYENGIWVPFLTGTGDNSVVVTTITQPLHGLVVGNYVRINTSGLYVKALADSAQNAELAGLVIAVQDVNTFTLQTVGKVFAGVFTGLSLGGVYFLSDTTPGLMTLVEPTAAGYVSLPVFIAETATTGWLRHSRGVIRSGVPLPPPDGINPHVVTQPGHPFVVGDWLRVVSEGTYTKAIANSLDNSQAVGVVIAFTVNTFTLQQSGFNTGAVTVDDQGAPIQVATAYYLSSTVSGRLTDTAPIIVGEVTKPLYIQETAPTDGGWILDQRPLVVPPGGGGGSGVVQVVHNTIITQSSVFLPQATWVALPGITITITPQSAADQIMLNFFITTGLVPTSANFKLRLTRDGVEITGAHPAVTNGSTWSKDLQDSEINESSIIYVDSPSTVAPVVYGVQAFLNVFSGATLYINRGAFLGELNGITCLTATELS